MAEKSAIEWTDATFNPWWGCTKVSPGCDHCYAERDAGRYQPERKLWGVDADRRFFGEDHWHAPTVWERKAIREDRRIRVFCASMADVFDNHPALPDVREMLWDLIRRTPHLDWLILTKRIGNVERMLPKDWGGGYQNVWLGISVVNQTEADRDIPKLVGTPAKTRFLSCEPLLGPIDLEYPKSLFPHGPSYCCSGVDCGCMGQPIDAPLIWNIDWVIVGGESGPRSRPMELGWARTLQIQCEIHRVEFFMKQLSQVLSPSFKDFSLFPRDLQVREWPQASASQREGKP